jgi:hypothetical protein
MAHQIMKLISTLLSIMPLLNQLIFVDVTRGKHGWNRVTRRASFSKYKPKLYSSETIIPSIYRMIWKDKGKVFFTTESFSMTFPWSHQRLTKVNRHLI